MRVRTSIKVAVAPEQAWSVVGDLRAADRWVPGVVRAQVERKRRLCDTADGDQTLERITWYSDDERSFDYAHIQQRLPIERSRGTLSVRSYGDGHGDGSLIVWEAEFDPMVPEAAALVSDSHREALTSLARLLAAQAPLAAARS